HGREGCSGDCRQAWDWKERYRRSPARVVISVERIPSLPRDWLRGLHNQPSCPRAKARRRVVSVLQQLSAQGHVGERSRRSHLRRSTPHTEDLERPFYEEDLTL